MRNLLLAAMFAPLLYAQGPIIVTLGLPNGTVGVSYDERVTALLGRSPYTWSVAAGALPNGLTLQAGPGRIRGTPTTAGTFGFTINVADRNGDTDTRNLAIVVDPSPLSVSTASLPDGIANSPYSQTLTAAGGSGAYSWDVSSGSLPGGLALSSTGVVAGTPTTSGATNFTARVTDGGNHVATKGLSLRVTAANLGIPGTPLPDGTVGVVYSQSLTASGGTGGYSWNLSAGSLPAGLSLSIGGAISGTPTTPGMSNFTVQVKDSSNATATRALSINVGPAALTVTTASLPGGIVATAYAQTLTASGGTGGYVWSVSAGSLPAGLSLSTAGTIAGTPTAVGPNSFTVQVKDSSNVTAAKTLSINVAPAALTVTTVSLPGGVVATAYAQTLTASGGTGGYAWSVSAGSLPAGLSLSTNGTISGTPAAVGPNSFTVQVKDSSNVTATKALSINVAPAALTVTTVSLPGGVVATAYVQTLTASGGTGGYVWSVSAGSLPAGLSLSTNGTISGTPTAIGPNSFTVQVKDSSNVTATKALSINVAPAALTVTTVSLPGGVVATAYTQTLTASGGTGGYAWSVSAGSLPAGLSLSTAGTIAGTPTAVGPNSFTVQVKDSSNVTATKALSINVAPAALTVTTVSLPGGVVATAYTQTLTASGGTGGYVWSVSAGSLPAGLSLSTNGTISGTPTTPGPNSFTVQVKDSSNATATKALSINVAPAALTVTTVSLPGGVVATAYTQTLTASGGTGGYVWSVSAGSLPAGLSLSTNGTISGTPAAVGPNSFTVQVKDSSNVTATKALSINVAPAALTVTTVSLPGGVVATAYAQTLTASGGTGGYVWSVSAGSLPAGLALSAAGAITGTPTTPGPNSFTVQVKDSANVTATKALSINVASPALTVTTASLPDGTSGAAYAQTLTASGGTGGYSWSVSAGTLPPGLALSAAGAIAGTPTTPGPNSFTVQVKDSSNTTATKALSINIASPALTITTASLPDGTSRAAYAQTLTASGGAGGYSWSVSAGTLPPGLALSGAGAITGAPTTPGPNSFTVQVKDSANTTATKALSINVAPPTLTVTTASLPDGTTGAAYSQTLAASGGTGGYQWSLSSGTLPAGLALSAAGAITGTPTTPGPSSFTVQVKDAANATATKALSINIASPALTITTASLPDGTSGAAYSQTLAASGGTGGYQWSLSSGTLPAGLALSAAGAITGTPTTLGPSSFTVQVKDSANATTTKALSINIASPGLTITTASLPDGTTGAAYAQTLTASGGAGGYSWSVSAGTLPAGLALSAAGAITGTPTTLGPSSFTVQVKDSANATTTKALSINIASSGLTITTASLPDGTTGAAYAQTLTASGGAGGYSWSVSAGTLPAGLALSAAGAITGTPTTPGPSSFTVQVKDSANANATKPLTLKINSPPIVITTGTLPNAAQGSTYSQVLAATGGSGTYRWSITSGSLPGGLALDVSGRISGVVNGSTSTFTVQAADPGGLTATRTLTLTVTPALLFTAPGTLPAGLAGSAYNTTITASGGTPPYAFAIISGQLPDGIALNPSSGAIAGTPVLAGEYVFTLQVTDNAGTTVARPFTMDVRPALTTTVGASLASGSVGAPYREKLTAAGGIPPYTWSLTAGVLPNGIALNASTGDLAGTPTQAGSFPITVEVRDTANGRVQTRLNLTVVNGLTLTTPPILVPANLGRPYQAALGSAGGRAPYIWSVTIGSLPPGLTFHADGKIDGTPTTSGTFTFTALVVDADSSRATKEFTLTVAGALVLTSQAGLPDGATGVPYSVNIAATGGTPPYVFAVTAGAAPAGLTLEAPTGALAGTPTETGTFRFTVTLTDAAGLTALKEFAVTISPGLTFSTPAALPGGIAGAAYSFTIQATGGQPPYSYLAVSGELPPGLTLNASSGVVAGTPSTDGTFNFTVEVTDARRLTASRTHSIVVGLPAAPALGLESLPATLSALQQPVVDLTVSDPYPVAISGRLNLRFTPAAGMPDDPSVQFSSGGRTVAFTIPPNSTHAVFPTSQFAIQTGSVAGSIDFMVESLDAAGKPLPAPASSIRTAQIAPAAPMMRSVAVNRTSGGFDVVVVGLSTTRELKQATVRFRPSAGSNLQTSEVTIPLSEGSQAWFVSSASAAFGGQFTLTLPFSVVGGGAGVLDSVTVILSNAIGSSGESAASVP